MINNIELKLTTGKTISLTHKEAKELYEDLTQLLGNKSNIIPPLQPQWIKPTPDWNRQQIYGPTCQGVGC